MARLEYLTDVVTLRLDVDKCIGCGMCIDVCPQAVLALRDGKAMIFDKDLCMECGACEQNCPTEAITVRSGVGCAAAILSGAIRGTESVCGCGEDPSGQQDGSCSPSCCS